MRRRRGGIILIIFGVLLAATVGGAVYVLAQQATTPEVEETASAVVVLTAIAERTLISSAAIGLVEVPKRVLPATALTRLEDATGKMTMDDMYPGDWVLSNRIADTKGGSGFSFTMEEGQVLVTFPSSDIMPTGAIRQGDYVDLIITLDTSVAAAQLQPGQAPEVVTQLTMQNLRVLFPSAATAATKTGQTSSGTTQQPTGGQLMFSVPREDALVLKHLKDSGAKIEIVLRPAGDNQVYSTDAVVMRALIERFNISAP